MKNLNENVTAKAPAKIFAQASPHSVGGVSMFEPVGTSIDFFGETTQSTVEIDSTNVINFFSEDRTIRKAVAQLLEAGFEVLQVTPLTINIAGSRETYERAFNTRIVAEDRREIKEFGKEETATFWDSPETDLPGLISTKNTAFADTLEGVAIEVPRYFMAASMFAPLKSYWHLRMPGDVSLGCNADRAHRNGITGKGIKVAMCDSGWFKHPYFVGRGYNVAPVVLGPGAALPLKDESGHGTGESANIFAVAPDIDFLPVKMSFVNTIGAFNAAVGLNPHIITCSWGSSKQFGPLSAADAALAAAIAAAVAGGKIVIFSAGNGHYGFPGQHPDVVSAGGVFMNFDEALSASNYSSGFMSNIYPNRRVPDVCGLVGKTPKAIYIMLPVEPNDEIDVGNAGLVFPNGDETANNDGWAAFSGTSAAAPQLAGAAALIKQACPSLTPAKVRDILKNSAKDVTVGNASSSTGSPAAGVGPDTATGHGLVDAYKAVLFAKIQCNPFTPITSIGVTPITSFTPVTPITAIITPITPITAVTPILPGPGPNPGPLSKGNQPSSVEGTQLQSPEAPGGSNPNTLTTGDKSALEDMARNDEINLGDFK